MAVLGDYFWPFTIYCFFHLILVGSPFFFFFFKILKGPTNLNKKSNNKKFSPHGNCFKKIDYFWKSHFQILVFDKQQMKWFQTRKRKLQEETQNSLDEVVNDFWESCSVALLIKCSEHYKKFPEKCHCKRWDLQQRPI